MDMFDGFVFLEEKKKSLIPILCQYDFLSALTAVYQFTRKVKALPGGALFKYDNGCSVFLL